MDLLKVNRLLANKVRLDILIWLKEPEAHFPPQKSVGHFDFGVCGQSIQEKAGYTQSTISSYLADLQSIGFLEATRKGKWTYFKRNEKVIKQYLSSIKVVLE